MFNMQDGSFRTMFDAGKKYLNLRLEYAKLTVTEKISIILGSTLFFAIVVVLALGAWFYFSLSLVHLLSPSLGLVGGYAVVGAVFLLLIAVVVIFKRQIILNPISRFISHVLLDEDKTHDHEQK